MLKRSLTTLASNRSIYRFGQQLLTSLGFGAALYAREHNISDLFHGGMVSDKAEAASIKVAPAAEQAPVLTVSQPIDVAALYASYAPGAEAPVKAEKPAHPAAAPVKNQPVSSGSAQTETTNLAPAQKIDAPRISAKEEKAEAPAPQHEDLFPVFDKAALVANTSASATAETVAPAAAAPASVVAEISVSAVVSTTAPAVIATETAPAEEALVIIDEPVAPVEEVVAPAEDTIVASGEETVAPVEDTIAAPVEDTVAPVEDTIVAGGEETVAPAEDTVVAPIEDTVAPVEDTIAPVEDTIAPVEDTIVPVEDTVTPVEDTVAPVEDTIVPVEDTITPVEDTVAPVEDTIAPAEDTIAPAEDTIVPVEDTVTPVEDTVTPAEDTVVPAEDTVTPVEDTITPVEDTVAPVEDTIVPAEDTVAPVEDTVTPVEDTVTPVEDTIVPVEDTVTPFEDTITPVEDTVTPVEDTVAPVEDTVAPVEDTIVPVEDTVTPVEDTVTPVEDTVTSVEDTITPPSEDTIIPPVEEPIEMALNLVGSEGNDELTGGNLDDTLEGGADKGHIEFRYGTVTVGSDKAFSSGAKGLSEFISSWIRDDMQITAVDFAGKEHNYNEEIPALSSKDFDFRNGIGTMGGYEKQGGNYLPEIAYDPMHNISESLSFTWNNTVKSAAITLDKFYKGGSDKGTEQGVVHAYRNGEEVAITAVGPDGKELPVSEMGVVFTATNNKGDFAMTISGEFDTLTFSARPYVDPTASYIKDTSKNDSSDYLIKTMSAEVVSEASMEVGDTLTGGKGDDTFVFMVGSGVDLITDFGEGDRLALKGIEMGNISGFGTSTLHIWNEKADHYDAITSSTVVGGNGHVWEQSDIAM